MAYDNEVLDDEVNSNGNPPLDNCYVNMSAGSDTKHCEMNPRDLDNIENINGVKLRHKRERDVMAELENHRLSGVSALSAVSGMTSESTLDLDNIPGQSWC